MLEKGTLMLGDGDSDVRKGDFDVRKQRTFVFKI